ncbi:transposase [Roseomonas sp. CCTCC AB2023176]|uniref:transposase n=1 Tax=Roseomonas sp. CCTCC AB2023176 TaxID=3342640 RepID=UPI0035DB1715
MHRQVRADVAVPGFSWTRRSRRRRRGELLYQPPLRDAQGMAGSLIRLAGLDEPAPLYRALPRQQRSLTITVPCRGRGGHLHRVIDRKRLKVLGEGKWKVSKHAAAGRRVWRKLHLIIDAEGNDRPIWSCPRRRSGKRWSRRTAAASGRDETLRALGHPGRLPWKRWSGDHRRSHAGRPNSATTSTCLPSAAAPSPVSRKTHGRPVDPVAQHPRVTARGGRGG